MAAKLCKELQILFGNNMKNSDFIDSKYILRNMRLKFSWLGSSFLDYHILLCNKR